MKIIGLMSGTSLDGLDICEVDFYEQNNSYKYIIGSSETISYPVEWMDNLINANHLPVDDFIELHIKYGEFLGKSVNEFISRNNIQKIDAISSHGHTIFHQPKRKITFQLGCGTSIFLTTGIKTIHDFRTQDVLLGGQGAPFVPIGDELLFKEFDACLNLGGFSNISFKINNQRVGFDISPVNIILNLIAQEFDLEYDKNGNLAKTYFINQELLQQLNKLKFYQDKFPKSLGIEWLQTKFLPILKNYSKEEKIATLTEHIAQQISSVINSYNFKKVLVTGGGTKNKFLIDLINLKIDNKLVIPSEKLIDFKEALIFAFLGFLKIQQKNNVLKSVTGAIKDHCSGRIN